MFKIVGCMVAFSMFFVVSGGQALAAPKQGNDCPPIVPKRDTMAMMHKMKAIQASTASRAEKLAAMRKYQSRFSRVIKKPQTWSGCHTIRDTLTIDAPVTVSAGTMLKFKANAGLKIQPDGSLNATGTSDHPIVFTATDKTSGYWYGLYFKSRSSHNRLIHTKVLYAGGRRVGDRGSTLSRAGGDVDPPSRAVLVDDHALLAMSHSTVAHSVGYGVEVLGGLRKFSHNTIKHSKIPMRLQLDAVGKMAASNRFTDNNKNQIDVIGNSSLDDDATWQDFGIPYNIRYLDSINADLKLAPGVVLKMGEGAELVVEHQGSLHAVGTVDKPIVIKGWNDASGYWSTLKFSNRSNKNVLSHVRVSDGGGSDPYHAEILVPTQGRLSVTHSVIANSKGYGVMIMGQLGKFSHNTIKNNYVPMRVEVNSVGHVDASNTLTDNDKQKIDVEASGRPLEGAAVWQNLAISYFLRYGMDIKAPLTLKPGVELVLGKDGHIGVDAKGSLHAMGTVDKPIVIHGKSSHPGYWSGIQIGSRRQGNIMKYVKISDGGGGNTPLFGSDIYVSGYLNLSHSWIENSAKYGIYVNADGELKSSDITFKNNKVNIEGAD